MAFVVVSEANEVPRGCVRKYIAKVRYLPARRSLETVFCSARECYTIYEMGQSGYLPGVGRPVSWECYVDGTHASSRHRN